MSAEAAYKEIVEALTSKKDVSAGSLFGKACIKLGTKAFAAFHKDEMVFKLPADTLKEASKLAGTHLWDPSGANRPMKEWLCIPFKHAKQWNELATQALAAARKAAKA